MVDGMPEAVETFVKTNDLAATHLVHKAIETYYKKDVTKYASEAHLPYIINAYDLIPSELSSKTNRFVLSKVGKIIPYCVAKTIFFGLKTQE